MKKTISKGTLFFIVSILFFAMGVIHITIDAISVYNNPTATSFPWEATIILTGRFYLLPVLGFLVPCIFFKIKEKKTTANS